MIFFTPGESWGFFVFICYEPTGTNIKNQRGDGCNI
jgi:hypothetical protein